MAFQPSACTALLRTALQLNRIRQVELLRAPASGHETVRGAGPHRQHGILIGGTGVPPVQTDPARGPLRRHTHPSPILTIATHHRLAILYDETMSEAAPKPRRTRRRVLWAAFTLLVLFIAWQAYDILTGKPQPKVDYAAQYQQLRDSVQPSEGEDAYPVLDELLVRVGRVFREVEQAAEDESDPAAEPYFSSLLQGAYRPHLWTRQIEAIQRLHDDGTLALSAKMAAMPRCILPPIEGSPFHEAFSYGLIGMTGSLRDFTKVQSARMRIAAHHRKWPEFIAAVDETLAAVQLTSHNPALIDAVNGIACQHLVFHQLRTALVEAALDETHAAALLAAFDQRTQIPSIEFYAAGERLVNLDMLQHIYTGSGRLPLDSFSSYRGDSFWPGAAAKAEGDVQSTIGASLAIAFPGHGKAKSIVNDWYADLIALSNMSLEEIYRQRQIGWSIRVPINQVAISWMVRDPSPMATVFAARRAESQATRIMLALELHIARLGTAPESLDALIPEFLASPPIDPICNQPYGYKRLDADPLGREYLLWSCGLDGKDDAGTPSPYNEWRDAPPGTDWIINAPRDEPEER